MSTAQNEAGAVIDTAIAEAVESTIVHAELRRSITQFLVGAQKDLPPEERTGSLIDTILATLEDEDR